MPDIAAIIQAHAANPWAYLPLAVLLGALHALEPGHSKSMMAAFVVATRGTANAIAAAGIPVTAVNKVAEGRPHIVDMIKNNEISFIVNTVEEKRTAITDSRSIRTSALAARVTLYTTVEGARAACAGMRHLAAPETYALQTLHAELK